MTYKFLVYPAYTNGTSTVLVKKENASPIPVSVDARSFEIAIRKARGVTLDIPDFEFQILELAEIYE